MAATAASSAMTREGWCLTALPGAFCTRIPPRHHHRLFLRLSSRPICLSLRKTPPLAPLVARTSDWAPQQGEGDNETTVMVEDDVTKVMAEEEDNETTVMVEDDVTKVMAEEEDNETKVMVDEGEKEEGEGEEWENAQEEYEEWQKGPEAKVEGVEEETMEEVGGDEGRVVEESYPEPPEEAKLFVGNLPYDIDSESLAKLFDQAGIVEIAEVIYNRETDQSRGFGFITMSTIEEADKAIEMFQGYDWNGRLLTVNKAAPRGTRPERPPRQFEPSFRVYVGNLPWQVDDVRLEQVFSEHGKVVDARVIYDRESGRSRGFGFVTMSTREEVDDAIAALDGQSLDGRAVRVNIAEERPRRGPF